MTRSPLRVLVVDDSVRRHRARELMTNLGILLLSQCVEISCARELLSSGNGGISDLFKDRIASLAELEEAIERIASGGTVPDPEVVAQSLRRRHDPPGSLTPREREAVTHMAEGRTNAAIATALFVGTGAVGKNVTSSFREIRSRRCAQRPPPCSRGSGPAAAL